MFKDSLRPFRAVFSLKFRHTWVERPGPYKPQSPEREDKLRPVDGLRLIVERAQNEALDRGNPSSKRVSVVAIKARKLQYATRPPNVRYPLPQKDVLDFLLDIRSLMTVERFSVYKCHFREDVAQHSYFTALYSMILADLERRAGADIDVEKLMRMALLHDAEEARTGDVHHPFKHQDSAFAESLDSRAFEWFGTLLGGLPSDLAREYLQLRKGARDKSSAEAEILKASDKIEALLWAYEEYLLGNVHVRKALIVEDILSKLDEIQIVSVKALVAEIRARLSAN